MKSFIFPYPFACYWIFAASLINVIQCDGAGDASDDPSGSTELSSAPMLSDEAIDELLNSPVFPDDDLAADLDNSVLSVFYTTRLELGYTDNVFFEEDGISSSFILPSVDIYLQYLSLDSDFSYSGFLFYEGKFYTEPDIEDETILLSQGGLELRRNDWIFGASASYTYFVQNSDPASDLIAGSETRYIEDQIPGIQIYARHDLDSNWYYRLELEGDHSLNLDKVDGYRDDRTGVGFEFRIGHKKKLLVDFEAYTRLDYDWFHDRNTKNAAGTLSGEEELTLLRSETGVELRRRFGPHDILELRLRSRFRHQNDDEGNYYDRGRWDHRLMAILRPGRWEFRAEVGWSETRYSERQINPVDDEKQWYDKRYLELEVSREVFEGFYLVLSGEIAKVRSNDADLVYTLNTFQFGAKYLF